MEKKVKSRPKDDYNPKHSILLLAKHHPAVQLLLKRAHPDNLHEDTEYVETMLQQKYWITEIKTALRRIKQRFVKCQHRNDNLIHPPMAAQEQLD